MKARLRWQPYAASLSIVAIVLGVGASTASASPHVERPLVAASPSRVLLEIAENVPDIVPLLRAEISDLGLEIVERTAHETDADDAASALAILETEPLAACRIVVKARSVAVWIFDANTRQVTVREAFSNAESAEAMRTAVLHAVELVRWSLRESQAKPVRPTPNSPETREVTSSPVRTASAEWFLGLSPLVVYSPGGTRPGMGAALDASWQPGDWGARIAAAGEFLPNALDQPEGTLEARATWVALQGVRFIGSHQRGFGGSAALGLSAMHFFLRGTAQSTLNSHTDTFFSVAPLLELRAYYAFHPGLSLGVGLSGFVPLRWDSMRVDGREVGQFGRLLVAGGLGLQFAL
ncbi:MAG: hypothetical protein QM756_17465 [Polyangiaceae bacterium]